ncbi:DUF6710 family protein [Advenella kashmirensis]
MSGGNHSLTAGIANGEGFVTSTVTHDITALYPLLRFQALGHLVITMLGH